MTAPRTVNLDQDQADHLKDLKWIRDEALKAMESCDSDQNFVLLGKLVMEAWREVNIITGASTGAPGGQGVVPKGAKVSDFQRRLALKRQPAS